MALADCVNLQKERRSTGVGPKHVPWRGVRPSCLQLSKWTRYGYPILRVFLIVAADGELIYRDLLKVKCASGVLTPSASHILAYGRHSSLICRCIQTKKASFKFGYDVVPITQASRRS